MSQAHSRCDPGQPSRVDTSDCAFLDSSMLTIFVLDARERAHDGQRTELLVPAANVSVRRTLQVSGLSEALTVH